MNNFIYEDMHVHSTFSDGVNSIEENIREAEKAGLKRLCCVDHVRRDTNWVVNFVNSVDKLKTETNIQLFSGLETKILNRDGDLDLPKDYEKADYIYIADHQFPVYDAHYHPKEIRDMMKYGLISKDELLESITDATCNAIERHEKVVLAHLFSILPKVGISEDEISDKLLEKIAITAKRFDVKIEVDERWKCPSLRVTAYFHQKKIPIIFSTDSHRRETIGKYYYNQRIFLAITNFGSINLRY